MVANPGSPSGVSGGSEEEESVDADRKCDAADRERDAADQLTFELTRLVLASNLEFVRGTTQTLQALSAALLTASTAATVALRGVPRFQEVPIALAILPTALFAGALVSMVLAGAARRKSTFQYNDLALTLAAYEGLLRRRRRELLLPGALVAAGLVAAFMVVVAAD